MHKSENNNTHLSTLPWTSIKRNGRKSSCTNRTSCARTVAASFSPPDDYQQEGRKEAITRAVARELVRGSGIHNIRTVFALVFGTIYKGINALRYDHKPKKERYGTLEIDEFWTSVGKKGRKVWLIYAYDRRTGDIVVHIWKRRNARTAEKLRRLIRLGVSYDAVATDN